MQKKEHIRLAPMEVDLAIGPLIGMFDRETSRSAQSGYIQSMLLKLLIYSFDEEALSVEHAQ
jgi:hypothetical protein